MSIIHINHILWNSWLDCTWHDLSVGNIWLMDISRVSRETVMPLKRKVAHYWPFVTGTRRFCRVTSVSFHEGSVMWNFGVFFVFGLNKMFKTSWRFCDVTVNLLIGGAIQVKWFMVYTHSGCRHNWCTMLGRPYFINTWRWVTARKT